MTAARSYNGWPASPNPQDFGGLDNRPIPGTDVRLAPGVRAGDVAVVAFYICAQIHKRVEPAVAPGCWGYYFRPNVNDPDEWSCHASGTGWDYNAPRHPNGIKGTWTRRQIAEVRRILAEAGDVVAWGEFFRHTTDGMHFEISGTTAQVAAAADKIRAMEDDMAMTPAERKALVDDIAEAAAAKVWAYAIPVDAATRKTYGYTKGRYAASALLRGADARGRTATNAAAAARDAIAALRSALGR